MIELLKWFFFKRKRQIDSYQKARIEAESYPDCCERSEAIREEYRESTQMKYYLGPDGKEHEHIVLFKEETEDYLAGWYFERDTPQFQLTGPFGTIEECEGRFEKYYEYLGYS